MKTRLWLLRGSLLFALCLSLACGCRTTGVAVDAAGKYSNSAVPAADLTECKLDNDAVRMPARRALRNMYHSSVMMLGKSGKPVGAGTIIFGGTKAQPRMQVLTVAHVVVSLEKEYGSSKANPFYLLTSDGRRVRWTIKSLAVPLDLALLETESVACLWPQAASLESDEELYSRGATVWSVGALAGHPWHMAKGVISAGPAMTYRIAPMAIVQFTDTAVYPGSSGGGVFSSRGRLVGIVSGTYIKRFVEPDMDTDIIPIPGTGVFISLYSIRPFLSDLK